MSSPAKSSAEALFRSIFASEADAYSRVEQLVLEHCEENEWREFKGASWFGAHLPTDVQKRQNEELKKYWSENLAAFANSGDGLLIWGIDAPKDVAKGFSLPRDASALALRLRELQAVATDPLVPGVEVRVAQKPGSQEGCVVCLIPSSFLAPHSAVWAEGGYFVRAQASNVRMRTEMLRRMFYPRTSARLIPIIRGSAIKAEGNRIKHSFVVNVRNDGLASARSAFIDVTMRGDGAFDFHLNGSQWKSRHPNVPNYTGYECSGAIHPGETIRLLSNVVGSFAEASPPRSVLCAFRIFAEDAPPLKAEVTFEVSEIVAAATKNEPIEKTATVSLLTSTAG